jgi:hypothetical protein
MATIKADKYIDNVQYLIKNIRAEAERIAIANQDDIIDFVREDQMLKKGTDGNGFFLAKYTSTRLFGESGSDSRGFPKIKGTSFNLLEKAQRFVIFENFSHPKMLLAKQILQKNYRESQI